MLRYWARGERRGSRWNSAVSVARLSSSAKPKDAAVAAVRTPIAFAVSITFVLRSRRYLRKSSVTQMGAPSNSMQIA